jgi:hypothetical protein
MPVRQSAGRDHRPGILGLARPFARQPHVRGAAYATYVGCWRSRSRVTKGEKLLTRFKDETTGDTRAFCSCCRTPVAYSRARSSKMVNIPRALFDGCTGREPLYHVAIDDSPEWAYRCEKLRPLKGYPGVMWTGPRRRKRSAAPEMIFGP